MQFAILGPLTVVASDGRRVELASHKLRSLLALLVIEANHVVSLDRIIDQLWGDEPPAAATGTLQAYVSQLRRVLEPGRRPREAPTLLVTAPPGYVLRAGPDQVDALCFQRLVEQGDRLLADGKAEFAEKALTEALALWRGEPLADLAGEAFVQQEAVRLGELRLMAWERRAEAWLAVGRHASAIAELEALVAEHPLRERLWALWMMALYRGGRQADALRAFQRCRTTLEEELGLEPGPELRRLEQAILGHEPIPELQAPATLAPSPPVTGPPSAGTTGASATPAIGSARSFVGRATQLRRLSERLADACARRGGVVLLEGEPGIGKTRLAEEAAMVAEARGMVVAWSRASETAGAPPFWPWIQILRSLAGGRAGISADSLASLVADRLAGGAASDEDDPSASWFRLTQAVVDHLIDAAARQPLLVVIEDLHWADASSRQLLARLAGELARASLLVVATFRPGEDADGLEDLLGALARERNCERMLLRGLSVDDVDAYLRTVDEHAPVGPGLADALHARTDGNPFFLIELMRLLTSEKTIDQLGATDAVALDVPGSVRDVILRRLARLPQDTQTLLRVAAVLGRDFELDVLEAAAGVDADRMMELIEPTLATGLVTETPDAWKCSFSHALVRDTLYSSLTRLQRARLHRRIGEALEAVHGPSATARLDELAHHFCAARPTGTAAKAVDYSRRAATAAAANLAHDEAVGHWERALAALDPAAPTCADQRYEILIGLAEARRRVGDVLGARNALEHAIAAAAGLGDERRVANAACVFGGVTLWNWRAYGEVDRAMVDRLESLLASAHAEQPELRAQLLGTLAVELYYSDQRPRRETAASEAVALARSVGDPSLLGRVLNNAFIALWTPDREDERRAVTEEALALVGKGLPRDTEVIARMHRMWSLLRRGELDLYDAEFATCARLAGEVRIPEIAGQVLHGETGRAILAGHWRDAERLAESAFERLSVTNLWGAQWCRMVQLFTLRREQGRLEELMPELLALCDEPGGEPIRPTTVLALAHLGRHDEAARWIADWGSVRPFDWSWDFLTAQWAAVAALVGQPDPAALYEDLLPRGDWLVVAGTGVTTWGSTHTVLGLLARRLGRAEAAARHFETSVTHNRRLGARPFEARARFELARLRQDTPELDAGAESLVDLLGPASEIAGQVGMAALAADMAALAP